MLKEVNEVRGAIRAAPKILEDTRDHVVIVRSMVKDVTREPRLRRPPIIAILARIEGYAQELVSILKSMETLGQKSKFYQSMYFLVKGYQNEARLKSVMGRLETAKSDLGIQIQVAHVGTTTELATAVRRMENTIQLAVKKEYSRNVLLTQENEVLENSNQVNTIFGSEGSGMTANLSKNVANGNAEQRNLVFGWNTLVDKGRP